ncbi:MAG TPA: hypothetical protein VKB34_17430, partial [Povalibacter sp.]|nr:hypothetical protein [Povalibacter sp.]
MKAACLLALLLISGAAAAQSVQVRTRLDPAAGVVVGQPVKLYVDVLTDSFFIAQPELPALDIPGVIIKLSDERPEHLNEQINGTSWYGIRFTYVMTPIAATAFDIPRFAVTAFPGPTGKPVTAHAPDRTLVASSPPGAEGAFVTRDLRITQHLDVDPAKLHVGDALTRTIELVAMDTPAMFIPVIEWPSVRGLTPYPKAPELEDVPESAGPVGHRIESTTYILQQAGDFTL